MSVERIYIPVLQLGPDRYVVFTTRWDGETYFARSFQYLKHRIIYPARGQFWQCATREVALMLATDSIAMNSGWHRGLGSELTPRAMSFPVTRDLH